MVSLFNISRKSLLYKDILKQHVTILKQFYLVRCIMSLYIYKPIYCEFEPIPIVTAIKFKCRIEENRILADNVLFLHLQMFIFEPIIVYALHSPRLFHIHINTNFGKKIRCFANF